MRKKLLQSMGLLLLSVVMAGCSFSNQDHGLDAKNPVSITIWHYYNGAQAVAFDELVTDFNNTIGKEKGIVVTAESKGSVADLASALNASKNEEVGAEDLPNMFQAYLDTAVEFDTDELLVDLDQYVSKDVKDQYVDSYIEEGCFGKENEWKLFPIAKSTEVMMINQTDWEPFSEASGYTTDDLATWEGLAEVAGAYYDWSDGQSFFGRDSLANYLIVGSKQLGDEIFQVEDGNATLNMDEEVMRKLWDNYYVPYVKGYYKEVGRYRSDDIKLKEIIAMVCSSSGATYFPEEVTTNDGTYPIDYIVLPIPNFEGCDPYAVQQGASVAVVAGEENEEYASVLFLEWITEKERNLKFSVESGYVPVREDAGTVESFQSYLESREDGMANIENDTITVSLQEVQDCTLFTSKGFVQGFDARSILEKSMDSIAVADRAAILDKVAAGTSEEDAVSEYISDEHFQEWYQDTKTQLENCLKE